MQPKRASVLLLNHSQLPLCSNLRDSSLVAVAVDSNPVVEVEVADSNLDAAVVAVVAAVEAVAVVEQVGSTAFGLEPRGEGGLLLYRLRVRT